jgi:hypothetical protein
MAGMTKTNLTLPEIKPRSYSPQSITGTFVHSFATYAE